MKLKKLNKVCFGLRFLATGKETNGKYFISETTVPAGDPGPPAHTHAIEDESFFMKSGKMKFTVNGKHIELNRGEFLNIEKGEKHTWKNDSDRDAALVIIFTPAGIENMFMELEKDMRNIKNIGLKYGTDFEI